MLCKKCKTAVSEDDKVCKYCGATLKNNNALIAIFVLIVLAAIALAIYLQKNSQPTEVIVPPITTSAEPTKTLEPTPSPEPTKSTTPKISEEPIPSFTPDLTKTREEVIAIVDNTSMAATSYVKKYSGPVTYISKNGYLYELSSDTYVKLKDLLDLTEFKPEYVNESARLLYLKPQDLQGIEGFAVKQTDEFEVFVAYETKEGFFMSSINNGGGDITKQDLEKVLEQYKFDQGSITRVLSSDADYEEIISVLKDISSNTTGFDVRSIQKNEKYCVAVVSPIGKSDQINEYILQKIENKWSVVVPNFETSSKYRTEINEKLIDFDFNLLPIYNMNTYSKYIATDFSQVTKVMKENSFITNEDEPVVFSSGTDDFVYLEFKSGKKFVGSLSKEGVWVMYPFTNYDEAVIMMKSIQDDAPIFILKQE